LTDIADRQIKVLKEAFMKGHFPVSGIENQLAYLHVQPYRIRQLYTEWTWERTENSVMLSTAEVLKMLKDGLITAQVALTRLINLGWANGDALVEIADVQKLLSEHAAATTAKAVTAAAKSAAISARQDATAAAKAASAAAKAQAAAAKLSKAKALETYEQLVATDAYFVHHYTAAAQLAKGEAKGDQNVIDEAKYKDVLAYEQYLIKQLKIVQSVT
jgi:hypothetical protein